MNAIKVAKFLTILVAIFMVIAGIYGIAKAEEGEAKYTIEIEVDCVAVSMEEAQKLIEKALASYEDCGVVDVKKISGPVLYYDGDKEEFRWGKETEEANEGNSVSNREEDAGIVELLNKMGEANK